MRGWSRLKIFLLAAAALIGAPGCRPTARDLERPRGAEHPDAGPAAWWLELEQRIEEHTNRERAHRALSVLRGEDALRQIARLHSRDMQVRRFFSHVNPDGASPAERVAAAHRRLVGVVGENLWKGIGYPASQADGLARQVVAGWMRSHGHRKNLLDPDFTHLGVGAVRREGEIFVTQLFAGARAWLDAPAPVELAAGSTLKVHATAEPGNGQPQWFDIWSPQNRTRALGPALLGESKLELPPGLYQLRLYFAGAVPGLYTVYFGPTFRVN